MIDIKFKRKIVRVGNSYGIIIPQNIMKLLSWDVRELEAYIDTKKEQLVIKKVQK